MANNPVVKHDFPKFIVRFCRIYPYFGCAVRHARITIVLQSVKDLTYVFPGRTFFFNATSGNSPEDLDQLALGKKEKKKKSLFARARLATYTRPSPQALRTL